MAEKIGRGSLERTVFGLSMTRDHCNSFRTELLEALLEAHPTTA